MTYNSVFERIRDYYQNMANALNDEKEASKIFPNPSDSGSTREKIFKQFLETHLPKRCDIISGGFLINSNGSESKQIDIIVTNDLTLQFKKFASNGGKAFCTIEGCYAAIAVKSELTEQRLVQSLDEFASIPKMPQLEITKFVNPGDTVERLPFRIIFAFSGINCQHTMNYINEYYKSGKIPIEQTVDLVIVNNEFVIQKVGRNGGELSDGTKLPPFAYVPMDKKKYIGGYGLWQLITMIQLSTNLSSHILLGFQRYTDKIIDTLK